MANGQKTHLIENWNRIFFAKFSLFLTTFVEQKTETVTIFFSHSIKFLQKVKITYLLSTHRQQVQLVNISEFRRFTVLLKTPCIETSVIERVLYNSTFIFCFSSKKIIYWHKIDCNRSRACRETENSHASKFNEIWRNKTSAFFFLTECEI